VQSSDHARLVRILDEKYGEVDNTLVRRDGTVTILQDMSARNGDAPPNSTISHRCAWLTSVTGGTETSSG
jgi:hypothetical protein